MQARSGITRKPLFSSVYDVESSTGVSDLIYCYLAGQCIAASAKTNYTLDSIASLVYLENSSNLESFEAVRSIAGSKSIWFHKRNHVAHALDVAHSLADNTA